MNKLITEVLTKKSARSETEMEKIALENSDTTLGWFGEPEV